MTPTWLFLHSLTTLQCLWCQSSLMTPISRQGRTLGVKHRPISPSWLRGSCLHLSDLLPQKNNKNNNNSQEEREYYLLQAYFQTDAVPSFDTHIFFNSHSTPMI